MTSLRSYNFLLILGLVYFSSSADGYYMCRPCNGSIAQCDQDGETMMMESETIRRILAAKKYISPGALKPDQPVCKGDRGEAYTKASDCLPSQSNPPDRGCEKYYRCRS